MSIPASFVPPVFATPPAPPTETEIAQHLARLSAEATDRGYQDGLATARREIDAMAVQHAAALARLEHATAAFGSAADQLNAHDRATLHDFQDLVVELAVEVASTVLGREVRSMDAPVVEAAKRAAALVPNRADTVVRVHPDDLEQVTDDSGAPLPALAAALGGDHRITVVPDSSVEAGACLVHVGALRIDTQIAPALQRMRDALAI